MRRVGRPYSFKQLQWGLNQKTSKRCFNFVWKQKKPSSVKAPPLPAQGSSHPWEWAPGAAGCYVCEALLGLHPRAPSPWRRPRRWEPSSRPADRELAFEAGGQQCPSPAGSWCSPSRRKRWCFIVLAPGASRQGRAEDENQQYWKSRKPGSASRACNVKTCPRWLHITWLRTIGWYALDAAALIQTVNLLINAVRFCIKGRSAIYLWDEKSYIQTFSFQTYQSDGAEDLHQLEYHSQGACSSCSGISPFQ